MYEAGLQNLRVVANANSLISKTLERIEATVHRKDTDTSLDKEGSEQSLQEMQQLGHLLLGEKLGKLAQ